MTDHEASAEESQEIAEKVRSGEYFREARAIYDVFVHDPMAERYLYLLITTLSLIIFGISLFAARGLYPLQTSVPFIVSSNDIVDDLPRIGSLLDHKGETANDALLKFFVQNYIMLREGYDIEKFERNISGVKSQSTSEVFASFEKAIDQHNPESPVVVYQRHSRRIITIVSSRITRGEQPGMEVEFEATVEGPTGQTTSRWMANVAFQYSGVELDEKTDKVKPISFIVTGYETKRL